MVYYLSWGSGYAKTEVCKAKHEGCRSLSKLKVKSEHDLSCETKTKTGKLKIRQNQDTKKKKKKSVWLEQI